MVQLEDLPDLLLWLPEDRRRQVIRKWAIELDEQAEIHRWNEEAAYRQRITDEQHHDHPSGRHRRLPVDHYGCTRIDHLGKRREVQECHTLKTLKAAQDKQAEIKADRKRGQFAKREALTFDQLCDRWLNSRHDVREVTVLGYRYALKVARELLGQVKVQELERTDIEKVIKTLQMRGAVASFSRLHARNDQTGVGVRDFIGAAVDQRGAV